MIFKTLSKGIITDLSDDGTVKGMFSAFGNIDAHKDMIQRGAYAKTISEWGPSGNKRIKFLLFHDSTKPAGVIKELYETERGLEFVAKFSTETTTGKDAYGYYKDGIITEHSVGIDVMQWEKSEGYHVLKEVRMYEGSGVMWGANPETPTLEVKALEQMTAIEKALKKSASFTDAEFKFLESKFLEIKSLYLQMKAQHEPPQALKEEQELVSHIKTISEKWKM